MSAESRRTGGIAPATGHAGGVVNSAVTDTKDSVAIVVVVDALIVVRPVTFETCQAGLNDARLRNAKWS